MQVSITLLAWLEGDRYMDILFFMPRVVSSSVFHVVNVIFFKFINGVFFFFKVGWSMDSYLKDLMY